MKKKVFLLATVFLALVAQSLRAQNKLLTIDDIFDPLKRSTSAARLPPFAGSKTANTIC